MSIAIITATAKSKRGGSVAIPLVTHEILSLQKQKTLVVCDGFRAAFRWND